MSDLFIGPRDLMDSAQGHLEEIIELLRAMFNEDWTERYEEFDSESGDLLHKVRFTAPVPLRVATRIFNVVSELRASLDHAVYAASAALGERPDPSNTKFPFGDNAVEVEVNMRERAKHVPDEIKAVVLALKPYEAGNVTLWRLNKLRNVKDHRKLIVPAPSAKLVDASATGAIGGLVNVYTSPSPDNDYVIARVRPGARGKLHVGFIFHVAFYEVEAVKGLDPVGFLAQAHTAVGEAIAAIEKATIRILEARG